MAGRTVLIIAHRLALAYAADQIVVMDAGRAVETGSHERLLAQDGFIANWSRAMPTIAVNDER